jgi:hypothetical protein
MTDPQSIKVPIDGTLDLHAFLPAEVMDLVPEYLAACRERGIGTTDLGSIELVGEKLESVKLKKKFNIWAK